MLNSQSKRREFWTIVWLIALLWIVGLVTGLSGWLVLAGLLLYMGWNLYYLWRLVCWLDKSWNKLPIYVPGIWGYVFHRLEVRKRKSASRKKQIARLLKSFKSSTRALPDATIVLNSEFLIQWVNEAATEILGIRKSDAGQPVTNLIRNQQFDQYLRQQDYSDALTISGQLSPDQRLAMRIIPFEGGQLLLQARDITEQHKLDLMRRDFVANASHELRTPLSVLQGSIEHMEEAAGAQAACARPLERMRRQSERMMRILEDLLILARLESGKHQARQPVALSMLVGEVAEEARLASEQAGGHRLELVIEPDIFIEGQYEDVHAAVSNLAMNAVRYTPAGGEIRLSLKLLPAGVAFEVSDTGAGILPQHLPRLTERFYRVDVGRSREAGGTGLGLSIVKHVLERYHAKLKVDSTPGKGSVFSFSIGREFLCQPGPRAIAG